MTTFNDGWGRMSSKNTEDEVLLKRGRIEAWVVRIKEVNHGVWIARSADGSIRAEFDNRDEAKDFLMTMINARGQP